MKKAYEKPKLFAESFALSEHISNCVGAFPQENKNFDSSVSCNYVIWGESYFAETTINNPCAELATDATTFECYNGISGNNTYAFIS